MKIEKLNFSVRTYNILKRANINDVEQLRQLSDDELLQIRNLGRHSFEEIKEKLECYTITNADFIRSMSDEELASIISSHTMTGACNDWGVHSDACGGNCKECLLKWLAEPFKENEE